MSTENPRLVLIAGIFEHKNHAIAALENLIENDFPPDQLSLLQKNGGFGDDILGLSYSSTEERVKAWGKQGMFWGGIWGLLASTNGMFIIPGLGVLLAAGPIVSALGGALSASTIIGGTLAGAAVLAELASALHEIGIPKEHLDEIHRHIEVGKLLLVLHCHPKEQAKYALLMQSYGAWPIYQLPIKL